MKKLAIVFVVAVLVPSLVLAGLAMRSIRDQEIVVQSQLALLHQGRTDSLAADMRVAMDDVRSYFGTLVDEMAKDYEPDFLCTQFDSIVRSEWGQVSTGCVVTDGGEWVAPQVDSAEPRVQEFLRENRLFLTNRVVAEYYQAPLPMGNVIQLETMEDEPNPRAPSQNKDSTGVEVVALEPVANNGGQRDSADPAPGKSEGSVEAPNASEQQQQLATRSRSKVAVLTEKLGVVHQNRYASQNESQYAIEPRGNGGQVVANQELSAQQQANPAGQVDQQPEVPLNQTTRNVKPFSQLGDNGWSHAAEVAEQALFGYSNSGPNSTFQSAAGEINDIIGDQPEGP